MVQTQVFRSKDICTFKITLSRGRYRDWEARDHENLAMKNRYNQVISSNQAAEHTAMTNGLLCLDLKLNISRLSKELVLSTKILW